jgi:hypothetical protein
MMWFLFCKHLLLFENDVLLSVIYFYNIRVGSNDVWLQNAISYSISSLHASVSSWMLSLAYSIK